MVKFVTRLSQQVIDLPLGAKLASILWLRVEGRLEKSSLGIYQVMHVAVQRNFKAGEVRTVILLN